MNKYLYYVLDTNDLQLNLSWLEYQHLRNHIATTGQHENTVELNTVCQIEMYLHGQTHRNFSSY